jgi:hypothetical protein
MTTKIKDLNPSQLNVLFEKFPNWVSQYHPNYVFGEHPKFMAQHYPQWVFDNHEVYMMNENPNWVYNNYPDYVRAFYPKWIEEHGNCGVCGHTPTDEIPTFISEYLMDNGY